MLQSCYKITLLCYRVVTKSRCYVTGLLQKHVAMLQGCYEALTDWLEDNVTIIVGVIFGIILIEVRIYGNRGNSVSQDLLS